MSFQFRHPKVARVARVALLLAIPFALLAQHYDSMSAAAFQRRLERYTDDMINELRSRRNTPLNSSNFNINASSWAKDRRAREEQERAARDRWLEKQRLDAEWARDHPGETREQYNDRMDREHGAREAIRLQRLANRAAAQRAEFIALQDARRESAHWADFRRAVGGFAARERPPVFTAGQQAADWLLAHDRERPNQWAAVQAALLLLDGVHGVTRDLPAAAKLVDPHKTSSRPDDDPVRPESFALHAYVRAVYPEAVAAEGKSSAATAARRELEKLAETSPPAKWLLARLLADSANPADQERALVLLAPGYAWAVADYAPFFGDATPLRRATLQHLDSVLVDILQRHRIHLGAAQRDWTDDDFQRITRAVGSLPSASSDLVVAYTEVIAERAIAASPEVPFDDYHFGEVIAAAGRAGSATAHAIATLDRLSLLHTGRPPGTYKRPYDTLADMDLAIPALTSWAHRDDRLGIRARLALAELADPSARAANFVLADSPEGRAWAGARNAALVAESDDYQAWQRNKNFVRPSDATKAAQARVATAQAAAFATFHRRERSAPPVAAIPRLLTNIEAAARWQHELAASTQPSLTGATPPPFTINDASFDLAKAAALLDAAFSPSVPAGPARNRYLYAAGRLGDAYAPYALSIQPSYPGEPSARHALQEISRQRRVRDEAAGLPRALLAKAIDALLRDQDATGLLAAAAQAGTPLPAALQLDQRIGKEMARETDRPPSWNLPPHRIAELDAAVSALHAQADTFADWTVVHALASPHEVEAAAQRWFGNLAIWDLDRQERLAEDALAQAIQPQADAVLATLADWPGINHDDPRRAEWTAAAERDRAQAQEAIRNGDGPSALRLFLAAAGRGDRGALELLSRHIRQGDAGLPRSSALADQFQAASFRMTITDAEVGDAFAANYVGQCYLEGRHGAEADPAKATEWLRYAAAISSIDAARTLATPGVTGLTFSASEVFQRETIRDALEQGRYLLRPPRRVLGTRHDTTSIQAQLEAAAAKLATFREKKPVERSEAAEEKHAARVADAKTELEKSPLNGLVLLAKVAAEDDRYAAQDLARILATGDYGLQPAPDLARRFLQVVLGDLERTAEHGNEFDAHHLACRALTGLDGPPDTAIGLRWLTYAAERGNYQSALLLIRLHTEALVPGIAPNPSEAARWAALADRISNETLTPRQPLKK